MAIKLLCPECSSDALVPHFSPVVNKTEKFKCLKCGKIRLITKMSYETINGDDSELEKKGKGK